MACRRAGGASLRLLPTLASFLEGSEHSAAAAEVLLMMLLRFQGSERESEREEVRQFLLDQFDRSNLHSKLSILEVIHLLESDPATARAILEKLAADADKEVAVKATELLNRLQARQES